ncbi:hypothetical protein [Streptomyces blastmyceticus]|uniref:hypothetical protein n=1 Tax=Streptomyces blastmyceticus TaxID=68180 RepID=UPI0031DD748D
MGGAGPDGVAEREEGLALGIDKPPGSLHADVVNVDIRWEGQDTAVVTFKTLDF